MSSNFGRKKRIPLREKIEEPHINIHSSKHTRRLPLRKYTASASANMRRSHSKSKSSSYSPDQSFQLDEMEEQQTKPPTPIPSKTTYLSSLLGSMNQFFPDMVDDNIGRRNTFQRSVSEYVFSNDDDNVIECVKYVDPEAAGNAKRVVTICRTLSGKIPGAGTALVEKGPAVASAVVKITSSVASNEESRNIYDSYNMGNGPKRGNKRKKTKRRKRKNTNNKKEKTKRRK